MMIGIKIKNKSAEELGQNDCLKIYVDTKMYVEIIDVF